MKILKTGPPGVKHFIPFSLPQSKLRSGPWAWSQAEAAEELGGQILLPSWDSGSEGLGWLKTATAAL